MNIGFALCGSFCTFQSVFPVLEAVAGTHNVIPILSDAACSIDSRFGTGTEIAVHTAGVEAQTLETALYIAHVIAGAFQLQGTLRSRSDFGLFGGGGAYNPVLSCVRSL